MENGKEKVVAHVDRLNVPVEGYLESVEEIWVDGKKTSYKFEKYYDKEGELYQKNGEKKYTYGQNGITVSFRSKGNYEYQNNGYQATTSGDMAVGYKDEEEMNNSSFANFGDLKAYK